MASENGGFKDDNYLFIDMISPKSDASCLFFKGWKDYCDLCDLLHDIHF